MRRVEDVRAPAVQHVPPARRGRLHAEPQKTERCLADDRPSHAERRLHDNSRERRWHDVAHKDVKRRRAQRTRRLNIFELTGAQHLATDDPRVTHPADDRERDEDVQKARAEHRDERDRKQQPRECQQDIHGSADHFIPRPAEVARHGSENRAHRRGYGDDGGADEEGNSGTRKHARQDVAAELVQAERMRERRSRQAQRQILCRRIKRRQPRSGDRRNCRDGHNRTANREEGRPITHSGSADRGGRTRRR